MIYISTQCFPPDLGGIQNYVFSVAEELSRQGNSVVVYADVLPGVNTQGFDTSQRFTIIRFGGFKPLRRLRKARAIAGAMKKTPGVLLCDTWKSVEYIKCPDAKKTLCLAHGMEFPAGAKPKKIARVKRAFAKADHILANSHFTANRLNSFLPEGKKAEIFWPGISAPPPVDEKNQKAVLGLIAGAGPVLLTVGRIEARKGHDKVIASMPELILKFPNIIYAVIGDGPDRPRLQSLVESLGLQSKVKFLGPTIDQQKSAWLASCDLFVMPSRAEGNSVEGFGLVYLEAAWYGKASIAGLVGGAADAVVDGKTGLLCDSDQVSAVTESISTLLGDDSRRQKMGAAAQARVTQEFMWPQVITKLMKFF